MPPSAQPDPDAREVDRVDVLATAIPSERADAFLARCVIGSTWTARIRTAEVEARVVARSPLGTIAERDCTCVRLKLKRAVPVEPRLRFEIEADDGSGLIAACLVRPWKR